MHGLRVSWDKQTPFLLGLAQERLRSEDSVAENTALPWKAPPPGRPCWAGWSWEQLCSYFPRSLSRAYKMSPCAWASAFQGCESVIRWVGGHRSLENSRGTRLIDKARCVRTWPLDSLLYEPWPRSATFAILSLSFLICQTGIWCETLIRIKQDNVCKVLTQLLNNGKIAIKNKSIWHIRSI